MIAIPLKMCSKAGRPNSMDFGRPNAEIGRKMANGWLLFLALYSGFIHMICLYSLEVDTDIHTNHDKAILRLGLKM